jgi:hypothetical protein
MITKRHPVLLFGLLAMAALLVLTLKNGGYTPRGAVEIFRAIGPAVAVIVSNRDDRRQR